MVTTQDLLNINELPTFTGKNITVHVNGSDILFSVPEYPYYPLSHIIIQDIIVIGGVIHITNNVLRGQPDDVVDIIVNDPSLSTLASLVVQNGLVSILQQPAQYTVFAPNNDAFTAASNEIASLTSDGINTTLQYHVLPIVKLSYQISTTLYIFSINNFQLTLGPTTETFYIQAIGMYIFLFRYNDMYRCIFNIASRAEATEEDLECGNGVVHKIDTVLLPFGSLIDVIGQESDLTIFKAALDSLSYYGVLNIVSDIYTVFAPTDDAFNALFKELGMNETEFLADRTLLSALVPYHIIPNQVLISSLNYGDELQSINGFYSIVNIDQLIANDTKLNFTSLIDNQGTFVDIIETDISSLNGVIHKLSQVLVPILLSENEGSIVNAIYDISGILSTLKDAIKITKLLRLLGTATPITLLAPTNTGFAKLGSSLDILFNNVTLLTELLSYHIIPGNITSDVLVNNTEIVTLDGEILKVIKDQSIIQFVDVTGKTATVLYPDYLTTNGVLHAIDDVLDFGSNITSTNDTYSTITELISSRNDLTILASLLQETGLNETLNQPGTFTIFSPINDAFAWIDNLDEIVQRFGNDTSNILLYHTLGIIVKVDDLSNGLIANTLYKNAIITANTIPSIGITDIRGGVSNILQSDIIATNGVVHIIDRLLIPGTIAEYAAANPGLSTLVSALDAAGLVDTLNATNTNFTVLAPINDAFNGVNQGILIIY